MEILNDDLYRIVISFLSPNDRIILREVNSNFKDIINTKNLIICKLENKLKKIYIFSNLPQTIETSNSSVHKLFRITNYNYNKCIDHNCREKKMGYIHLSFQSNWFCYKRKIHYCVDCFNKWI